MIGLALILAMMIGGCLGVILMALIAGSRDEQSEVETIDVRWISIDESPLKDDKTVLIYKNEVQDETER